MIESLLAVPQKTGPTHASSQVTVEQALLLLCPLSECEVLWSACLYVSLFVCLSARVSKTTVQMLPNFLCMSAVARSSSDGNMQPTFGLWMTSCYYIMVGIVPNRRRRVCSVQFVTWRHQSHVSQRYDVVSSRSLGGRTGAQFAVSDCILSSNYWGGSVARVGYRPPHRFTSRLLILITCTRLDHPLQGIVLTHLLTQFYLQITPCLPLLPSRRASPPFGWYSFTVPRRVEG